MVSYTSEEKGYEGLEKEIKEFKEILYTGEKKETASYSSYVVKNEGFKTAGQVQHVATAGNFKEAGFEYTGALRILKVMLSYEYLWMNISCKRRSLWLYELFQKKR